MSHFYGCLQGASGQVTRTGTKKSGMSSTTASYSGAVSVRLSAGIGGTDIANVSLVPWKGSGISRMLYSGAVGSVDCDYVKPLEEKYVRLTNRLCLETLRGVNMPAVLKVLIDCTPKHSVEHIILKLSHVGIEV